MQFFNKTLVFASLGLASIGALPATGSDAPTISIEQKDGAILFREGEKPILRYVRKPISRQDGRYRRGHYVHPLYSLNGTPMSDDMPADHPHHRGVFWAWSQLWLGNKLIGQPWEQKGLVWKVREVSQSSSPQSASITCDVIWNSPQLDGGKDLVSEMATITVHQAAANYRRIDFRISLLALEKGVRIGGSKNSKGYGGFSARIPMPDDLTFTGPEGTVKPNHKAPTTASSWIDFSGSFDDSGRTGIAILTGSSNPGYPHGWTLRPDKSCQNPVFPGAKPYPLSMTKPLVLNYSLVLHNSDFSPADLKGVNQSYQSDLKAIASLEIPTPPIHLPDAWIQEIKRRLPEKLSAQPKQARKVLLFSTATGYKHEVIPYVQTVLKMLTENTGAAEMVISNDVNLLRSENISQFDALIFNNCCSDRIERNLFRDIFVHQVNRYATDQEKLSKEERGKLAKEIEQSIINHIASGKGLMLIHGGIAMMNGSAEFDEMLGGSFDYHPKMQEISLQPVEPGHPLLAAFDGKPFVHTDEPYMMKGAYTKKNFRPLLEFDPAKVKGVRGVHKTDPCYVSWIKPHGKGRIFYVSPSHMEQSYLDPRLLQFYLDGLQYTLGDLECDDSTPTK